MSPASVDHAALAVAGPWIDTHCHLSLDDDHPADPDAADTRPPARGDAAAMADDSIDAAHAAGVTRLITIATDAASAKTAIAIAQSHDDVWATVGLHPHDASRGTDGLAELLDAPRVVAVGECGLDYHYEHSPRAAQRDAFARQIALARSHDLALVVHTRSAWDDTFAIFDAEGMPERTIIHCFTGGPDEARACLDRGAYLSFSGIVTFRNAPEVREAAALCPSDRMLVETDSPFLAPVPYRGRSNRPAWVPVVGAMVASARGSTPDEVARAVWSNAEAVFGLG